MSRGPRLAVSECSLVACWPGGLDHQLLKLFVFLTTDTVNNRLALSRMLALFISPFFLFFLADEKKDYFLCCLLKYQPAHRS